jgi:hypothetical protein
MAQKKHRGSGRVTPKGTANPTKTRKPSRVDPPEATSVAPPHELRGKAGKQSHKAARPITHNRGNR